MQPYANQSGTSGVTHYALGSDYIDVRFRNGHVYRYDHARPGPSDVQSMRALAAAGRGLATYISRHVRKRYARRLPDQ